MRGLHKTWIEFTTIKSAKRNSAKGTTDVGYVLVVGLFLAVPVAVLVSRLRGKVQGRHYVILVTAVAILVPYLVLLASFAAVRGVVHRTEGASVAAPLGFLPVEHYAFIALQVLLVGSVVLLLWRRLYPTDFE